MPSGINPGPVDCAPVATEIVELTPDRMPALRRFAERVWTRPRSDAFYRWRYAALPLHRTWLALRDGEVLATECAFQRPYRIGDEPVDVLEVFDWFVLPELRNSGVGVRIQQHLMKLGPCLLVGGSADTQALLPRLKFQIVAQAGRWVLPLGSDRLAGAIAKRVPALPPALAKLAARAALARPGQKPRARAVPPGGRAIAVARVGDEIQRLYRGPLDYAAVPLWPAALLEWMQGGHPSLGHFLPLYFARGETLVGWALVRIYATELGCDAELVECFAPRPDVDTYTWMVSEIATRVAAFDPGLLGACTACPLLGEALARNRFVQNSTNPVQLWWPGRTLPPGALAIGANSGDSSLVPFAQRWFDDQA
jgi:hypothetical protein